MGYRKKSGARDRPTIEHGASDTATDDLYHALADEQRRELLAYMLQADRPMSLDDLATYFATNPSTSYSGSLKELRTRLHHDHLPRLDDYSLLEYNPDQQIVRTTPTTESLQPVLEADPASQ